MRACVCCMRYGLRSGGDRETGQLASAPPPRAGASRRRPRPIPQPRARELSSAGRRGAAGKWRAKPSCGFSTLFAQEIILVSSQVYWFRRSLQSSGWHYRSSEGNQRPEAMKSPVPATCRHRRDKRRSIAHVVRHGASAVQVSRPSSSTVARNW